MAGQKHDSSDSRIASLKLRDKEYNELYRKWRIEHKNDYGFYFAGSTDELTYRDGEGFINESPQAAERAAGVSIHSVLAKFLIIYTSLSIFTWVLSWIFPTMGAQLRALHSSVVYENELFTLLRSRITALAVRLLPLIYLLNKVKMPRKIFLNFRIYNKPMFNVAVPAAMLVFGICTAMQEASVIGTSLMGIDSGVHIWIPQSRLCFFISAFCYIIVFPIVSEIIHHGIILQILKQFGDGYSLVVTSVIAALTMKNGPFLFTFMYMFVIGYFSVRSGSLLTAFVMRFTISGSTYLMAYLSAVLPPELRMTVIMALIFVYLVVGLGFVTAFIIRHSNKISLPMYDMYLGERERLMSCLTVPSVIIWLAMTAVYTIMTLEAA